MMPDDSGSIAPAGNTDAVRDGHNFVLDALAQSKQSGEVLAHTRYLNGHVLCPYTALDHAVDDDARELRSAARHAAVRSDRGAARHGDREGAGARAGRHRGAHGDADHHRRRRLRLARAARPADVKALVADMLAQENHIVAAMGINDGTTDFREVFRAMGIPDRWILTPGNSATRDPPRVPGVLAVGGAREPGRAARRVLELVAERRARSSPRRSHVDHRDTAVRGRAGDHRELAGRRVSPPWTRRGCRTNPSRWRRFATARRRRASW